MDYRRIEHDALVNLSAVHYIIFSAQINNENKIEIENTFFLDKYRLFSKVYDKNNICIYTLSFLSHRFKDYTGVISIKYDNDKIKNFYCFMIDYHAHEFSFMPTCDYKKFAKKINIPMEYEVWKSSYKIKDFTEKVLELVKKDEIKNEDPEISEDNDENKSSLGL